jgi:hypothetical protein
MFDSVLHMHIYVLSKKCILVAVELLLQSLLGLMEFLNRIMVTFLAVLIEASSIDSSAFSSYSSFLSASI